MAISRHLPNAPITEALLDFRVKLPTGFDPEVFRSVAETLRDRFPKVDEQRAMEAVVEVREGKLVPPEARVLGLNGYILRSADGKNIAQFRTDGFTFNRLKPYTSWDELFPQAFELWNLYEKVTSPEAVTRLAVRYINHLRIPGPTIDLDDYLTAGPKIPPELPQGLSTFLIRVVIHDPEPGLVANVTQAYEPAVDPRFVTVILDIDAYKVREWNPSDQSIVQTFNLLRGFKNRVFFSYITESTARLFE